MEQVQFQVRSFATDFIFNDNTLYSIDKERTVESFLDELSKKHSYDFFRHALWLCKKDQKPIKVQDMTQRFKELPFEQQSYLCIQMSSHGFDHHSKEGYTP